MINAESQQFALKNSKNLCVRITNAPIGSETAKPKLLSAVIKSNLDFNRKASKDALTASADGIALQLSTQLVQFILRCFAVLENALRMSFNVLEGVIVLLLSHFCVRI